MSKFIEDSEGHRWPITGYWCPVCRLPLHESQVPYGAHPTCALEATA